MNIQYPVKDLGQALNVLNPNREPEINVFENGLYVDLDSIRGDKFLNHIYRQLGIKDGQNFQVNNGFAKILLTGHRGSGKSVELKRMMKYLDKIYLPVYINIEKQLVKLSAVAPEDIYQLLIIELMELLVNENISFSEKNFKEIVNNWVDEKTITEMASTAYNLQVGAEAEAGISAFIFKLRAFLKSSITSESKETDEVRRKVKNNISDIILRLNNELALLQPALEEKGYTGFLFVLDGTEKLAYDLAKKIFISDAPIFNQINSCFIFASPVFGLYDIQAGLNFFNQQILPMAKLTDENVKEFKKIVTRRVDEETFFDEGVLDCLAKKSGGSIRLFIELCYDGLLNSRGTKVDKAALKDTLYDKGLFFYRKLDKPHKDILKETDNDFDFGNERVKEMLFSLILLVQNGKAIINPLVKPFIDNTDNYLCD